MFPIGWPLQTSVLCKSGVDPSYMFAFDLASLIRRSVGSGFEQRGTGNSINTVTFTSGNEKPENTDIPLFDM